MRFEMVGRGAELSQLGDLLDLTRAGASGAVIVEGEPGIGKSRFVEEICALAGAAGFEVFRVEGQEFQSERPFWLISSALKARSDAVGATRVTELLDEAQASFGADHRFRIIEAIEDLLERQALEGPVLLAIDDAQWADSSSLLALHAVSRRTDLPVFLLIACRPVPRSDELNRLLVGVLDLGGHHLLFGSLDDDAVAALARARLNAEPGARLRDQLARTSGNPLFVLELLDGLEEEHRIEFDKGAAESSSFVEPPPSLRALIIRRLGVMSGDTVELLRTASVMGDSFSASDLAAVTEVPLGDVIQTLKEPIAAGFVTAVADALTFRHDLVRETLYSDIPAAIRKGLHLHVGRTLAAIGAPPFRVAQHVAIGAENGDRQAVGWLRDAALDVAPRAPELAIEFLNRAVDLLPTDDPERMGLLLEEVTRLLYAGKLERAEEVAEALAPQVAGTPVALMLDLLRMGVLALQFRTEEMANYADRLLQAGPHPEELQMQIVAASAAARLAAGDILGASSRMQETSSYVEANPTSVPAALALWVRAALLMRRGHFTESVEELARAVPGTEMFVGGRGQGLTFLGMMYGVSTDRFEETRATLEEARVELERRGAASFIVDYHWALASLHFITGKWDDALVEVARARELAAESGAVGIGVGGVPDPSILIRLFRGDAPGAEDALVSTDRLQGGGWIAHWLEPIRALVQDASGNRSGALITLRSWQLATADNSFVPDLRSVGRSVVRLCQAAGAQEILEQLASDAIEVRKRSKGVKSVEAAALLVIGTINDDPESLLISVDASREAGRTFDLAEACAEAGLSLLRRSDRVQGRPLVLEAFSLYEDLGAARMVAALAQDVRDYGIRRGARARRGRPDRGWDSLTESENRVVDLVAEGLTNVEIGARLFTSKGTVATHLRSVFRKLDVSSRTELAAEAARRGG